MKRSKLFTVLSYLYNNNKNRVSIYRVDDERCYRLKPSGRKFRPSYMEARYAGGKWVNEQTVENYICDKFERIWTYASGCERLKHFHVGGQCGVIRLGGERYLVSYPKGFESLIQHYDLLYTHYYVARRRKATHYTNNYDIYGLVAYYFIYMAGGWSETNRAIFRKHTLATLLYLNGKRKKIALR